MASAITPSLNWWLRMQNDNKARTKEKYDHFFIRLQSFDSNKLEYDQVNFH